MKAGKVWGERLEIHDSEVCKVVILTIDPGGFCSRHMHQSKHNSFHILEGSLLVTAWKHSGTVDETRLRAGDTATFPPGELHRFENDDLALARVIEIESVRLDPSDIQREDTGGLNVPE